MIGNDNGITERQNLGVTVKGMMPNA